jgi:hypothetical protein
MMSDIGYWWCRSCKCEVAPSGVTFSEHHEDCGCRVEWLVGHELTCIEELEAKVKRLTSRGIEDMHDEIEQLRAKTQWQPPELDDWDTPSQLDRIEDMLKEILAHLKKPKRAQKRSGAVTCSAFDAFWSMYPRKVSKKATIQAWNGLNRTDKRLILEVMPAWVESWKGTDVQFIPHPSTWINKRRFDDPVEMAIPKEAEKLPSNSDMDGWKKLGLKHGIEDKPGERMDVFIARVKGAMYR